MMMIAVAINILQVLFVYAVESWCCWPIAEWQEADFHRSMCHPPSFPCQALLDDEPLAKARGSMTKSIMIITTLDI